MKSFKEFLEEQRLDEASGGYGAKFTIFEATNTIMMQLTDQVKKELIDHPSYDQFVDKMKKAKTVKGDPFNGMKLPDDLFEMVENAVKDSGAKKKGKFDYISTFSTPEKAVNMMETITRLVGIK